MGEKTLFSKLLAAGLSSAVFLIWWPRHYPDAGIAWLVARGVLWTATFEFLLLAAAPVERRAWSLVARGTRADRLRARVESAPRRVRLGGWLALSAVALALVVSVAASAPTQGPARAAKPRVVKHVIVKHEVERVVVERPAPEPEVTYPPPAGGTPAAAPEPVQDDAAPRKEAKPVAGGGEVEAEPPAAPEEAEAPASP